MYWSCSGVRVDALVEMGTSSSVILIGSSGVVVVGSCCVVGGLLSGPGILGGGGGGGGGSTRTCAGCGSCWDGICGIKSQTRGSSM